MFSFLDEEEKQLYNKIPPHRVNGGHYTGEKAKGPWGSVPVIPDEVSLTNINLQSANPPLNALTQYNNSIRYGNNMPKFNNLGLMSDSHDIVCTKSIKLTTKIKNNDPSFPLHASF